MPKMKLSIPSMTIISSSSSETSDSDCPVSMSVKKKLKVKPKSTSHKSTQESTLSTVRNEEMKAVEKFNIYTGEIGKFSGVKKNINKLINAERVVSDNSSSDDGATIFKPKAKKNKRNGSKTKEVLQTATSLPAPISPPRDPAATCTSLLSTTRFNSSPTSIARRLRSSNLKSMPENVIIINGDDIKQMQPAIFKTPDRKLLNNMDDNFTFFDNVIDCEVDKMNDSCNDEVMTVKIQCPNTIEMFSMKKHQKFSSIVSDLAKILKVDDAEINLFFGEEELKLQETPLSKQIKSSDIILCTASSKETVESSSSKENSFSDDNVIELILQSNLNARSKQVPFNYHKDKPLKVLAKEFALRNEIDVSKISLKFDGDVVDLEDTPLDLDLEDGDCLDVIVR